MIRASASPREKVTMYDVTSSIILFDMAFYTQVDGVAMVFPLEPPLANAFLCHYKTKWLNDCPKKFKPVFYKRYLDDIFVLFKRPEHVKPFVDNNNNDNNNNNKNNNNNNGDNNNSNNNNNNKNSS